MDKIKKQDGPVMLSLLLILVLVVGSWLLKIVKFRLAFQALHGSLKAPPFSVWFGTIPAIADLYKHSPSDAPPHCTMTLMYRKHDLGPIYYLDNWPAAPVRQIAINDPELAAQFVQKQSLPKHWMYPRFVGHIVGKTSMIYTEGPQWKKSRTLFNPGFSAGHLMTLIPSIVDDVLIFCNVLDGLAKSGRVTPIEDKLARLTIDIMGHIVLDHDLNSQTGENELVSAFRKAVHWTPHPIATHPILNLNPVRAFAHWYYARVMDNYIKRVIQERLALRSSDSVGGENEKRNGRRPAIDLAVDEYLQGDQGQASVDSVDETFQQLAIDQMKTFIFAGHDTSSSTICYIYHLLNLNQDSLEKVRREHDEVFGTGSSSTAELIKKNPRLLNELPFTTAVIKETLRLYPPATTTRVSNGDFSIIHDGRAYSTKEDAMIWINLHTIHRRHDLFPLPDEFIPERFLPAPNNWQEVQKDSWRPFEKGPRACIGQELSMLEMKIIMALTLRDFDISAEYEEWDRMLGREKPGETLGGRRGMFGDRAYQVMKVTAKPSDGLPARVRRRES